MDLTASTPLSDTPKSMPRCVGSAFLFPTLPILLSALSLLLVACQPEDKIPPDDADAQNPCAVSASKIFGAHDVQNVQSLKSLSGGLSGVHTSQTANGQHWQQPRVKGQILLVHPELSTQQLRQQTALRGLTLTTIDQVVSVVHTPHNMHDAELAQRLSRAGLRVQPNYQYSTLSSPNLNHLANPQDNSKTVNDPGFPGNDGILIGKTRYDQDYLSRLNIPQAWSLLKSLGKTPKGVLTAVVDTGADYNHPDLAGRLLDSCSFVGENGTQGVQDIAPSGHGTADAGLIGATTNNGIGLAGVTWNEANVLPINVFEHRENNTIRANTISIRSGIMYAIKRGAKVINLSLGDANMNDPLLDTIMSQAAKRAVLIVAAGNTSHQGVYAPANHPDAIAVGALGKENVLACYSARPNNDKPRQLDLVAPGGNGGTSDTVTHGNHNGCRADDDYNLLALTLPSEGSYMLTAGTSVAAPLISGVASLVLAAAPKTPPNKIKELLRTTATKLPQTDGSTLHLVNAKKAIQEALKRYP